MWAEARHGGTPGPLRFGRARSRADFERRLKLYALMQTRSRWRPETDIDWSRPSSLDSRARDLAETLANSGTYTEELGLLIAGKLMVQVDDLPVRYCLAMQIADEAKHSEAFTRYVHRTRAAPPPVPAGVEKIQADFETIGQPTALFFVHTLLEGFAFDQFTFLQRALGSDPLADVYNFVRQDEARHVAMGIDYLQFALHQEKSDEVFGIIKWCEANIFDMGYVNPQLMLWLSEISGEDPSDIDKLFKSRHRWRLERIWREVSYEEA